FHFPLSWSCPETDWPSAFFSPLELWELLLDEAVVALLEPDFVGPAEVVEPPLESSPLQPTSERAASATAARANENNRTIADLPSPRRPHAAEVSTPAHCSAIPSRPNRIT